MRRWSSIVLIVTVMLTALLNVPTAHAQTGAGLPLSDCPFSVGLGEAKSSVDAKCGVLSVPEDRSQSSGRKIDLHVVVLPALKANATGLPIFHLEGGPGGSAIQNFGESWYGAYLAMRQDHSVVLIDQRGTGQSASLQCTEITSQAFADLEKITSSQEDEAENGKRLSTCLTRLSKTNDPQFYTSSAMADDTDAVRAALGYDQIEVFGNSYGTWLGQYYLKQHGEHVTGMVLDSVLGPWNNFLPDGARNAQAALDGVFALCKADTNCDKAYPDLIGQLQTALQKLKEKPVTVTGTSSVTNTAHPVGMTADKLLNAIFEMLYNSANDTVIPQAVAEAARGNYVIPASVLVTYAEQASDAVSVGLYNSVVCAEQVAFYDKAQLTQPDSGNVFKELLDPASGIESCKAWRGAELSPADIAPVQSDRPVLILSGGLDPVTPVRYGEETNKRLTHSTLAVFPYQAHGVIVNSGCARRLVLAFFAAPTTALDTGCIKDDSKLGFLGAYPIELAAFNDPNATFVGMAPKGWKAEQDGVLTFFSSPDGSQFAAAGVYKGQKLEAARKAVLDQLSKRFGPVQVQQELTVNALIISITAVVHSIDLPKDAGTGIIYLRAQGGDMYVAWQAAPSNVFQAVSLAITPQMLGSMRAR